MDAGVAPSNAEASEAWDGPLFERFVQYRHLVVVGLARFGHEAMRRYPPPRGGRVLDVGCGFGDTTRELVALAGPDGEAVGVDVAPRFIECAREEAAAAGCTNVRFEVADVQQTTFEGTYDHAFSRMGTMFFANPVAALRNVRAALRPEALFVQIVWRAKAENEWAMRGQQITERFVQKPETYDDPTCGPGPFAMGNADTVTGMLVAAGYHDITLHRCDLRMRVGRDLDEAADLVMALGPAGEILRLQGERAAHLHAPVRAALVEGYAEWAGDGGVDAPASTWIIAARA